MTGNPCSCSAMKDGAIRALWLIGGPLCFACKRAARSYVLPAKSGVATLNLVGPYLWEHCLQRSD